VSGRPIDAMIAASHWAASDPGAVRTQNEDAYVCLPRIGVYAVADGVGGHTDGGVAAMQVMQALSQVPEDLPPAQRVAAVRAALHAAHTALLQIGAARVPATTLATTVIVLMLHEDHFACLWVGDSRCYLLRDGELHRLTSDHSLVREFVESGAMTEREAETHPDGNVITRAIGAGESDLRVDKAVGLVCPVDRFLLCSDGLYKTLEPVEIVRILRQTEDVAQSLVAAALARHARDNVTAVVVDVTSQRQRVR
jgi:serine/threonine protein phosphatase Stp1